MYRVLRAEDCSTEFNKYSFIPAEVLAVIPSENVTLEKIVCEELFKENLLLVIKGSLNLTA